MKKIYTQFLLVSTCFLTHASLSAQCAAQATLGTANNMVGLLRNNSSAIAANKALNTITFIHRNNVTAFGGNSGHLRFDLSTNGGATWTNDLGVLNPALTYPGRYPNIAIYNPSANTNTANAYVSYMAPQINGAAFNGIVTGVSHFNVTGVTESYNQNGIGTTQLPCSLVPGAPGVFWAIEPLLTSLGFAVYKGVWSSSTSDIVWNINYTVSPSFLNFPSTVNQDYNIAFDPTGTTGYFCFTGHLNGGGPTAQTLYPILYKTTNGGTSWTGPITVDVTNLSCISSNTISNHIASINNMHDLVVDVNGNPHIITTVGNSSSYIFNYSAWHHMYDLSMKNGLWIASDLGNVNCAQTNVGVGATSFPQAQSPQASRSADGTKIFFTWADNSSSSLGTANTSPNLFGKGYDVTNDTWTPTKDFTSCNAAVAGKMLFPHTSCEVLEPTSTSFLIPTMYGSPNVTNDLDQLANFRYLDNITFSTSEFSISVPAATVTIPQAPLAIVCTGSSLTLNVLNAGEAIWNTGATTTSLSITSGTATSYSVVAQVGCNTGTASIAVANLSLNATAITSSICPGSTANFSVVGNALGYTWTPGNTTGTAVTLSPVTNQVTLTAMGSGSCLTTQTVALNILTVPSISITGPSTVCIGSVLTLTASGGQTYVWSNFSTNATFTDTPVSNIVYTVVGTAANTCTNVLTYSVFVKPTPTINATSNPTAICLGDISNLSGSGAVTYSWNGVSSPVATTVAPTTSSIYTLAGTGSNSCQSSKTVAVTVYALPSVTITPDRAVFCKGEKIKLTASGADTYTWISPASLTSTVQVTPSVTTVYTVDAVNTDGCLNTKTFTLTVDPCTGINSQQALVSGLIIYPNPNNGSFTIKGEGNISLQLMNELGQVIKTFALNENNSREVSITDVSAGIYFIVGQQDGLQIKQKIVITH